MNQTPIIPVDREIARLLRQQRALAAFGSFAFQEPDLGTVLTEAARICAEGLETPFCKVCRYRREENDLLVEAGVGWRPGVVGVFASRANETTPQGRAFQTGQSVVLSNVQEASSLVLPPFYVSHGIVSTIDVIIRGSDGPPYGVLEVDSTQRLIYDQHDVAFLTGFANVLAQRIATADRMAALHTTLDHMTALIEDKTVLAQELQHRVRNNLQLVNGMLADQLKNTADQRGQAGIRGIARRVMSLSRVYDHLLGVGMRRAIDFGEYVKLLCASLPELQSKPEGNVRLTCQTEAVVVDLDTVTGLGLVLVELVSNGYDHAFPNHDGTISVAVRRTEQGDTATMTVSDDGIGFKEAGESKRHGVGLVKRLMRQVDGTFEVRADRGTTWVLRFPTSAIPSLVENRRALG